MSAPPNSASPIADSPTAPATTAAVAAAPRRWWRVPLAIVAAALLGSPAGAQTGAPASAPRADGPERAVRIAPPGAPLADPVAEGTVPTRPARPAIPSALPVLAGIAGGLLIVLAGWGFAGRDLRRRTRSLEESGRALRQVLAEKESILDNALVGILLAEDDRLLTCNRRFAEMVGYREGELRTLDLAHMFSPLPTDLRAAAGQPRGAVSECRLIDRDGRERWVEVSVTAIDAPAAASRKVLVVVDIDARKRAEEALRAGEARFHAMFDGAARGMGLLDDEGRIIELNPSAGKWLGRAARAATGSQLWALPGLAGDEAGRARLREAFAQACSGSGVQVDVHYRQSDDSLHTVELSLRPVGGDGQRRHYVLAEASDVTARRLAFDALETLAAETWRPGGSGVLAAIAEHACRALAMRSAFIAELSADARQVQILAAWEDGHSGALRRLPIAGTLFSEMLAGGDVFHAEGACRRHPYDELIQQLPARACWAVALRAAGDVPIGFLVVMSDQTRPARSEARALLAILAGRAALELLRQRTEARLRIAASALEYSREGICIADQARRIVMANAASAELCGWTPAALEGQPLIRLGGDDFGMRSLGEVLDIADRTGSWQGELWIRRATGGDKFPLWLSVNRIDQAERCHYALIFFDHSQRRQAELERLEREANLQQVQRMESVGQLAGGIAHDFNNILTVVGGFTGLIRQAAERRPELVPGYLDEIAQATRRARDLVAQLLAFSRNERQAPETIIIAPIVEEAGKLMQASLPADVELDVRLPADLPDVNISPGRLHQVVMNLALNARDALGGRGRILITAARYRIDGLRTCDSCHRHFDGDFVALMVQDNGHGIPAELRTRIFDPFFTTKPLGQGSGLGLSVLHGIVHGAGGHLEVASAEGAGTTFRVLLPVAIASDAPRDAGRAAAAGVMPQAHAMVVDDDPATLQYVAELLTAQGLTVSSYTDPCKALLALRDVPQSFDLLIVDQSMPNLTGEDLAQESRLLRPDLPVILCAGFGEQFDAPQAARLGIRQYLLKPLMADALLRAVREALTTPA